MTFLKFLGLALCGLAALGSGLCTALFLPSIGREYVGWIPLLLGLPVFAVSALLTWLFWRSLKQRPNSDRPPTP